MNLQTPSLVSLELISPLINLTCSVLKISKVEFGFDPDALFRSGHQMGKGFSVEVHRVSICPTYLCPFLSSSLFARPLLRRLLDGSLDI
jgi:hypothetical protein